MRGRVALAGCENQLSSLLGARRVYSETVLLSLYIPGNKTTPVHSTRVVIGCLSDPSRPRPDSPPNDLSTSFYNLAERHVRNKSTRETFKVVSQPRLLTEIPIYCTSQLDRLQSHLEGREMMDLVLDCREAMTACPWHGYAMIVCEVLFPGWLRVL